MTFLEGLLNTATDAKAIAKGSSTKSNLIESERPFAGGRSVLGTRGRYEHGARSRFQAVSALRLTRKWSRVHAGFPNGDKYEDRLEKIAVRLLRKHMRTASTVGCKILLLLICPIRSQVGRHLCATTFS